jgi:hypothetical protein
MADGQTTIPAQRKEVLMAVESVNGKTGKVEDIAELNPSTGKLLGSQIPTSLAPIESPILTGEPKAPTPPVTDVSTRIVTSSLLQQLIEESGGMPIKKFGAKWDGVTDDSSKLQEAMEVSAERQGTPILLPAGTGIINSEPKLPNNLSAQVKVRGLGRFATTIKLPEALHGIIPANTSVGDTVGNIAIEDLTVDGNNVDIKTAGTHPVIFGTTANSRERVNIKNVAVRRVRLINVPRHEAAESARRAVLLVVHHATPGLSLNAIEDIVVDECEFLGAQYGAFVAAEGGKNPAPVNVYIGGVLFRKSCHAYPEIPVVGESYSANFQIGQAAWSDGRDIIVEKCWGQNSGDVGFEFDVPCVARDLWVINANNVEYLFNSFNAAGAQEPIVAKTTATVTAGGVLIPVESAKFSVGQQLLFCGEGVSASEVRTIKAIPDGEHVELAEAVVSEWASGTWLQQVGDMSALRWEVSNLHGIRTVNNPGANKGLAIQNEGNVIPCPAVNIDGYIRRVTSEDSKSGDISCRTGASNRPTGAPHALRIRNLQLDRKNFTYTGSTENFYQQIVLEMFGPPVPVEIRGEATLGGKGNTGSGSIARSLIALQKGGSAALDVDIVDTINLGATNKTPQNAILFLQGDYGGVMRLRTKPSAISGVVLRGIRLEKASCLASSVYKTTLSTEAAAKATSLTVESTSITSVGDVIVVGATSTEPELAVVNAIEGSSLHITGELAKTHAAGSVVALLNSLTMVDSDGRGLGTTGKLITAEDEGLLPLVRRARNTLTTGVLELQAPTIVKSNYTVTASDSSVLVSTASGAVTITVPSWIRNVRIQKMTTDANKLTIKASGATINGAASLETESTARPSYFVQGDGANLYA